MNVAPIVIEDDDVVMVNNVDDKESGQKQNTITTVDTIILDEGPSPATTDELSLTDSDKESSFARLLQNNALMNKIVYQCLNMKNNAGMSRVVSKTLLPLYIDVDHKFKQSEQLTELLKKFLKKLKHDSDFKFLHVKTLCEELKAGKYKRKVPFITLSTDLKEKKHKRHLQQLCKSYNLRKRSDAKDIGNIGNLDVINLDNSDDEPVISLDVEDDDKSIIGKDCDNNDDVMIVDDTTSSDVGSELSNKENSIEKCDNYTISDSIQRSDSRNKTSDSANSNSKMTSASRSDHLVPKNKNNMDKKSECELLIPKDKIKILNASNEQHSLTRDDNKVSSISQYDLLVPKKAVNPDQHRRDYNRVIAIEQQIAMYQEKIVQLEEEEVTSNGLSSPYVQCDRYKAKIVQLYKKLCKITGNGDGNLLKQRVVRLQVVEGHPAGPVKRLERFLNSTIDETGVVPLPDLHDVVRCVTQSNIVDQLGWNKQDIMREAIALFTQCGHALRKSRQRREYKDLLSLVRDKSVDDYDPANEDPHLFAKLEENKIIAKLNEDEILDKFVNMEYLPKNTQTLTPRLGNMSRIRIGEYADTDSDSDQDLALPKKSETHVITDSNKTEEASSHLEDKQPCNTEHIFNARNMQPSLVENTQETNSNVGSIHDAIDRIVKKALTKLQEMKNIPTINTINLTTQNTTNIQTIQNPDHFTNSNTSNPISHNLTYHSSPNLTNTTSHYNINTTSQNFTNTTEFNTTNQNTINISTEQITQNVVIDHKTNTPTNFLWSNPLQEIGNNVLEPIDKKNDSNITEINMKPLDTNNIEVKTEEVTIKEEPVDINSLLEALGDNYISTIFDIEDPFLVVEISSDSSSDDDS